MGLKPQIKKNWIEIQKRHDAPVNAIGVKINPKDEKTLKVWPRRRHRSIRQALMGLTDFPHSRRRTP